MKWLMAIPVWSTPRDSLNRFNQVFSRCPYEESPLRASSFLVRHFCCAKVVACGRVIEREWGNPSKVPPSHSPFLAVGGSADNKTCGQSQKKKHHPSGWCFLFGMPRAGLNLLPRPARSALNQEVRQGSCEWLCHSWDAGSESSLVARSKKERHPCGVSFLSLIHI